MFFADITATMVFLDFDICICVKCQTNNNLTNYYLKEFLKNDIDCLLIKPAAYWYRGVGQIKGQSHSFVLDFFCYFFYQEKKVE